MTKEEAIKELNNMALILLVQNHISFKDAQKAREVLYTAIDSLEHSVPLSVIEKMRTEIEAHGFQFTNLIETRQVLSIIDQAIKECDR